MAGKQFLKKHENCILSLAMALILAGILAACFDFYYDLNDDVLIKDILSGVYSGTPPQKIGKLSRTILTCWTKI